jgi:hypothetical protein
MLFIGINHMVNAAEKIDKSKREYRPTRLQFPSDLGAHAMVFNFIKYDYDSTFTTIRSNPITAGSIVLPLPQNLEDSLGVKSNAVELGAQGAAAIGAFSALKNPDLAKQLGVKAGESITELISDPSGVTGNEALSTLRAASKFVGRNFLDSIAPGLGAAADVATGTAVNPHTTLDFDGVNLKQHTLQWTLSPRSERESTALKDILNTFRRNMLPEYTGLLGSEQLAPRALMKYPNLVKVNFIGVDQDHFYRFKPCMIQGMTVQYTQGNGVTLLKGGRPSVVSVIVTLLEASPHTKDDYSIGFNQGGR